MSRGPDIGMLVERALLQLAAGAGVDLTIVEAAWTRWASATFTGARHVVALAATPSPAFDAWLAELPEADFALRRHLVADLEIESRRRIGERVELWIAILTVEDA